MNDIFSPTLCMMETALGLLSGDINKQPYIAHIVVYQFLMKHLWINKIGKDADLKFTIHYVLTFYPSSFHETFFCAVLLPVISSKG